MDAVCSSHPIDPGGLPEEGGPSELGTGEQQVSQIGMCPNSSPQDLVTVTGMSPREKSQGGWEESLGKKLGQEVLEHQVMRLLSVEAGGLPARLCIIEAQVGLGSEANCQKIVIM